MDGVQELLGVTVVAATNRPDVLVRLLRFMASLVWFSHLMGLQDSALMRPGRLDRIVYVGPPDQKGREEILNIWTRSMSVEPGLNVAEIARIVSISSTVHIHRDCYTLAI